MIAPCHTAPRAQPLQVRALLPMQSGRRGEQGDGMALEGEVALPADPRAAGLARAAVRDRLGAWGLEHLADAVELLTSELVTNALLHAASAPVLQVVRQEGGVRVLVCDDSPVLPVRRRHSAAATTGRGVQMLQDLADEWGFEARPRGKAVWFVVTGARDPWAGVSVEALLRDADL